MSRQKEMQPQVDQMNTVDSRNKSQKKSFKTIHAKLQGQGHVLFAPSVNMLNHNEIHTILEFFLF